MTLVFYRSSSDGWRLGLADEFTNISTVVVTDVATKLKESVRPSDVWLPPEEPNEQKGDESEAPEERQRDPQVSRLLRMEQDPTKQYLRCEDIISMDPPPAAPPALVHCLRYRFDNDVDTTFIGDNFAFHLSRPSSRGKSPTKESTTFVSSHATISKRHLHQKVTQVADRAMAALRATSISQTIVAFGDNTNDVCCDTALHMAELLRASTEELQKLYAAHVILRAFTQGIHDEQRVLRMVNIQCEKIPLPEESSRTNLARLSALDADFRLRYVCTQFDYSMLDLDSVVHNPTSNMLFFGFVVFAFDAEEKERCNIPRRQVDFAALRGVSEDANLIARVREKYFVFCKAMETIGFEVSVLLNVCARISAVMHLLEVTFADDGTAQNMNSLRNAARLIQTDFNALSKVLTSKAHCEAAAKLLYVATFKYLLSKVNAKLNPTGQSRELSIDILGVPQPLVPPPGCSLPCIFRQAVINALYEDVQQAFLRTSERELVQWQQQGFVVRDELQAVFDSTDNYKVLKMLKAKGGIVHSLMNAIEKFNAATEAATAQAEQKDTPTPPATAEGAAEPTETAKSPAPPAEQKPRSHDFEQLVVQFVETLRNLGRHVRASFDEATSTFTVRHTFGEVSYRVPRVAADFASFYSIHHEVYSEMRQHLLATCDVDTQEALYFVEQEPAELRCELMCHQLWTEYQKFFFSVVSKEQAPFFWVAVIDCRQGFKGQMVEAKLSRYMASCAIELRKLFPGRYIAVPYSFMHEAFYPLLSRTMKNLSVGDKTANQRIGVESICVSNRISHVIGKNALLTQASDIIRLDSKLKGYFDKCAAVIQGCAKSVAAAYAVLRRVSIWNEALGNIAKHEEEVLARHKWEVENAEALRISRLDLQEKEHRERVAIRDEKWVAWVELETEHRVNLERIIQNVVAAKIEAENTLLTRSIEMSQQKAFREIRERVQRRLLQHGGHFDAVVHEQLQRDANARAKGERLQDVHGRILQLRTAEEEARLELELRALDKRDRSDRVAAQRRSQVDVLRDQLWLQQEKRRAVRSHVEKSRESMALQMQEEFEMEHIEQVIAKRLALETRERQRRDRELQKEFMERTKRRKEDRLVQQKKLHARKLITKEKEVQQEKELAMRSDTLEKVALLQVQERERRNAERLQREEEKRQKTMTRMLLRAHDSLYSPLLFEQTAQGPKRVKDLKSQGKHAPSIHRVTNEGFVMSGGKTTYRKMLDEDSWRGIAQYHLQRVDRSPSRGQSAMMSPVSQRSGRSL